MGARRKVPRTGASRTWGALRWAWASWAARLWRLPRGRGLSSPTSASALSTLGRSCRHRLLVGLHHSLDENGGEIANAAASFLVCQNAAHPLHGLHLHLDVPVGPKHLSGPSIEIKISNEPLHLCLSGSHKGIARAGRDWRRILALRHHGRSTHRCSNNRLFQFQRSLQWHRRKWLRSRRRNLAGRRGTACTAGIISVIVSCQTILHGYNCSSNHDLATCNAPCSKTDDSSAADSAAVRRMWREAALGGNPNRNSGLSREQYFWRN
mmetsp:Transcript_58732/g.128711  ORF Transcript_58732/g.128711 Transcript_58732/m.128711 type:complete len:266 (-) Transcript_58732:133-930(-)